MFSLDKSLSWMSNRFRTGRGRLRWSTATCWRGQHLESGVAPPGKENAQCGKHCQDGFEEHEPSF